MDFFTQDRLEQCITENKKIGDWFNTLDQQLSKYEINTSERVAGFLSQTAWESSFYTRTLENLNYSVSGLLRVFPKYFRDQRVAAAYARQPEKIANRVYASRLGNGDEDSGDGWKFRGRGLIQVTGKANYEECSKFLYTDPNVLLDAPEKLTYMEGAVASACWYWVSHGLNELADSRDVEAMTKRVQGGTLGLIDREKIFNRSVRILDAESLTA